MIYFFSQFIINQTFFILVLQRDAIAEFIYSSVFPAATAFSIKASDIAELLPKDKRSALNGIPNFWAISFTFS